jgi:methylated-DNA-[protein]-cysteine S-methyltransferase
MDRNEMVKRLREYTLTPFQREVLLATSRIPRGEVRTYKQIAIQAGHPNAYRAVGSVMKMNPLAPMIPCHRVIRSSGELGNYSGVGGVRRKRELLAREGMLI